jgi:hypothetical protein
MFGLTKMERCEVREIVRNEVSNIRAKPISSPTVPPKVYKYKLGVSAEYFVGVHCVLKGKRTNECYWASNIVDISEEFDTEKEAYEYMFKHEKAICKINPVTFSHGYIAYKLKKALEKAEE